MATREAHDSQEHVSKHFHHRRYRSFVWLTVSTS